MTVSAADAVKHDDFVAIALCFRSRTEVKFDVLPGITVLCLQPQGRSRLVAAMDHAVFTTAVTSDAVYDTISVPLHRLEQLGVAAVMGVRHQITRAFPAANVARRNGPGRAGQVAFAGKELEVNWRAEKGVAVHPLVDFLEL